MKISYLGESLEGYLFEFNHLFKNKTKSLSNQAKKYLYGLMLAGKSNMEKMCDGLNMDSDYQAIHHFFHSSRWDFKPVFDLIAERFVGYTDEDQPIVCLLTRNLTLKREKCLPVLQGNIVAN